MTATRNNHWDKTGNDHGQQNVKWFWWHNKWSCDGSRLPIGWLFLLQSDSVDNNNIAVIETSSYGHNLMN